MVYQYIVERYTPQNGKSREWPQILAVITAALGFFSTAALASWTSPSIPILVSNISHINVITLEEASYLTIIPSIAGIVFCPFLVAFIDIIGRKKTILIMIIFHILTWLLKIIATNLITLYVAKILQGIASLFLYSSVPIYITEVTQPKVRVSWGSIYALFESLGRFLINVIASFYDIPTTAFIMIWVPIIQLFLTLCIPESPYFYVKCKNEKDAITSLTLLRWTKNVEEELTSIKKNAQQSNDLGTYKDVFLDPINRKALFICFGIRIFQCTSGLLALYVWAKSIFLYSSSGSLAENSAIIYTGVFVVIHAIFNVIVGKFTRIRLMTISSLSCAIVLGSISVYFYVHEKSNVDISYLSWILLVEMLLYIPAASIGMSIIPSILCGELFGLSVKSKATCMVNIVFFIMTIAGNKLFQVLFVCSGMYLPFALFSLCCIPSALFFYYCVPETWGKSLTEIQEDLHNRENSKRIRT